MALETRQYINALVSHASSTGHFSSVNSVDVGSTPDNDGITAVIWPRQVRPLQQRSGLASTSVAVIFMVRLFHASHSDPLSEIDPRMLDAADALMNAYSGDFSLGGVVANIDLLGEYGEPLGLDSGWLEVSDEQKFRIVDITVPLVINDVWIQES